MQHRISRARFGRNVFRRFMNLRLSTKLIIGYLLIILAPTLTLQAVYLIQSDAAIRKQVVAGERNNLEAMMVNYRERMLQIESAYGVFQSNASLRNFLRGELGSESEELYIYFRDILPLFSYARTSSQFLRDVTIYRQTPGALHLFSDIIDMDRFPGDMTAIERMPPNQGRWLYGYDAETGISLRYVRYLYNTEFTKKLGLLSLEVKPEAVFAMFADTGSDVFFVDGTRRDMLAYAPKGILPVTDAVEANRVWRLYAALSAEGNRNGSLRGTDHAFLFRMLEDEPSPSILFDLPSPKGMSSRSIVLLVVFFLLLVLLSVLYYAIFTSITKRIVTLEKHIRMAEPDMLRPVRGRHYLDEVGRLTRSFNRMIIRINRLIDHVYKADLSKREAELYALHAQMNPHFFNNVLENIRMSAERHGDTDTSDMICVLARYSRYNMPRGRHQVFLDDEIGHLKDYLQIQKIRLRDMLQSKIDISTETSHVMCPRYILQPLVENAVLHGLKGVPDGRVTIEITDWHAEVEQPDDDIRIRISDNGCGMPAVKRERLLQEMNVEEERHAGRYGTSSENGDPVGLQETREPAGDGEDRSGNTEVRSGNTEDRSGNVEERSDNAETHGIAIRNIHQRLIGLYGPGYGIQIDSTVADEDGARRGGTTVVLRLKRGMQ